MLNIASPKAIFKNLYLLSLLLFLFLMNAFADASIDEAIELFQTGNLSEGISKCNEIIGTAEEYDSDLSKLYLMLSIATVLENTGDVKDKCIGFALLLEGYKEENKDEPTEILYASSIIRYLAGSIKEPEMDKNLESAENDWKASSNIAKYLVALKHNADNNCLSKILNDYTTLLSGYKTNNWATSWYPRIKIWNKWVISGEGDKNSIEKLVSDVSMEERKEKFKKEAENKYDSISEIISLYLQNKQKDAENLAKAKCSEWKQKNNPKLDPSIEVMEMLAGQKSPSITDLFSTTKSDSALWSMASLGLFVRTLAKSQKTDQLVLIQCLENFKNNVSPAGDSIESVSKWKNKAAKWLAWCEKKYPQEPGLEPLLAKFAGVSNSKSTETALPSVVSDSQPLAGLAEIKPEEFEATREIYKRRPRPSGLVFDDEKVQKYLKSLPDSNRAIETERYNRIKQVKEYLVRIMERNPFPKGLKLKSGMVSGTVSANENILIVKSGSKNIKRYKWEDLSVSQFERFLNHYAQQRLNLAGGGEVSKDQMKKDAAQDYILIALIYDWYGRYDDSIKYGQKAAGLDPSIEKAINEILLK